MSQILAEMLKRAIDNACLGVQPGSFTLACELISRSRRVAVFAVGPSSPMAGLARNALLDLGLMASSYTEECLLAMSSRSLSREDVALVISNSGTTASAISAIVDARKAGAFTICITHDHETPLAAQSEICLTTGSLPLPTWGGFMEAQMGQLFLLCVLIAEVAERMAHSVPICHKAIRT